MTKKNDDSREDFGMTGRFGFAPDADLTEHDRWHSAVSLAVGLTLYVVLVAVHLAVMS